MQNMSLYSGRDGGGNGSQGGNAAAQQQAMYAAHHGNHLVRSGSKSGPKKRDFNTNIGTNKHVHVHILTILRCYKMDRKLGRFL